MKQLQITETALRDGQQSLLATRMSLKDFASILDDMNAVGYYSVECWGGATFDSCLRYLDEDPWERLRILRKKLPNTKLQMLLRGQNLLGYHHYSDDTVRRFIQKSVQNGIDIIRIFDALNDLRNVTVAVDETKKQGAHAQGAICYTTSPIHTLETFVTLGKELEQMGCDSIAIKDMAGIMTPKVCFDLVSALKQKVQIPVIAHTHMTTGLGYMTYLKAVEAGADGIDCATSALAGGTSQPATESMVYTLAEMGVDCGLDLKGMKRVNDGFLKLVKRFEKNGLMDHSMMKTRADALAYQIPGGMLSNLSAQLKAQNASDKLDAVLEETPRVRADLGYPPLVTPLSQMVGVQATVNVLLGERYKSIGKEIKDYIRGYYGKAPGEINPKLLERVLGDIPLIEGRPADGIAPEFAAAQEYLGDLAQSEEDVLSYIAFPQQAEEFLKKRKEKQPLHVRYSFKEVTEE